MKATLYASRLMNIELALIFPNHFKPNEEAKNEKKNWIGGRFTRLI